MKPIARLALWLLLSAGGLSACGGGSSGGDLVVRDGEASRPGRELVLTGVPEGADWDLLAWVYDAAQAEPACQDPTDPRVPVLVAQTCLLFHELYLEPDRLPADVGGMTTPEDYVDALDPDDPFAFYYSAEVFSGAVEPGIAGERAWIGIVLSIHENDTVPTIDEVLPYSRGWWDGLRPGDRILKVRDAQGVEHSLDGLSLDQAGLLLPRTEEEAATLVIDRNEQTLEIPTAAETHIERLLDGDVAYLGVRSFTTQTADEVWEDYTELKELAGGSGPSGIVLDLRDDRGGSLQGALELADLLGPDEEEILHARDAGGAVTRFFFGRWFPENVETVPMVILVDGNSASASEIVAGALRYRGSATLVGETTFGKGVAQSVEELLDQSALFIPSLALELPDGTTWHLTGLEPDARVPAPDGGATPEDDPQLEAALGVLRGESPGVAAARAAARPRSAAALWEHRMARPDRF